jgi:prepilin-type N-terminal cleavage/methylation domain-containing protein
MKRGFTLIELLIVVAIIAILAAIAIPNFLEAQVRSKVSRAKTDMRTIATAMEAYCVDCGHYPLIVAPNSPYALTGGGAINGPSVFEPGVAQAVSSRFIWLTTPMAYITSVFRDPFINPAVKFAYAPDGSISSFYETYDYVDARSLSPSGIIGGTRAAGACSGAEWQVVSAGPDKKNCFGGGCMTGNYTMQCHEEGCDYDPSNGTISKGDIVRIGGGQGQFCGVLPAWDRIQNKKNF